MSIPQEVKLERHPQFLDDDGRDILENLATTETDTTLVPHPDGVGGVEWGADATGGGGGGGSGDVWVPLLVANPAIVTTTGEAVYVPLTTVDGVPILITVTV